METYTTLQGQAWDEIARDALGAERHMDRLIEANPTYADRLTLPAGVQLALPVIEDGDEDDAPLAPWDK